MPHDEQPTKPARDLFKLPTGRLVDVVEDIMRNEPLPPAMTTLCEVVIQLAHRVDGLEEK